MISLVAVSIDRTSAGITAKGKIYPEDNTCEDLSFMEFKLNLLKAIENKDVQFIMETVKPDTVFSFGGDKGPEGLQRLWNLNGDPDSDFWSVLERTLKMGCVARPEQNNEKRYIAPYTYANYDGTDSYRDLIILGHSVNLRQEPDLTAKITDSLDYEVVTMVNPSEYFSKKQWVRVRTDSGKEGYIHSQYLASPLDYRTGFHKTPDGWKMLFFVAGD